MRGSGVLGRAEPQRARKQHNEDEAVPARRAGCAKAEGNEDGAELSCVGLQAAGGAAAGEHRRTCASELRLLADGDRREG